MAILKEFRDFVARGNVIDLAVGVVIGGAFGKLVDGVVNGVIMPVVDICKGYGAANSLLTGLGNLGSGIVNFLLLAAVVFFIFVKPMNKLKAMTAKEAPPAPAEPSAEAKLLAEIRDMMKQQG